MNIKLVVSCSVTLLTAYLGSCWAASEDSGSHQLTEVGKSFLDAAAASDNSGIEMSKVAAAKSQSQAVRSFAQQMADDQSNNYRALEALCDKKGYAIAAHTDDRLVDTLNRLKSARSNEAFDRAYIDAVIADQATMESILERVANNSNDSDITRFASDLLSAVKKHEQSAAGLAHN